MGERQFARNLSEERESKADLCVGGRSWGCRKLQPHKTTQKLNCEHCNQDLGCTNCAQRAEDLICLRCREQATPEAMGKHGPIVKDREVGGEAFRIVGMIYRGAVSQREGEKLLAELFAEHNRRG